MTASRAWQPGALRQAIIGALGASQRGLSASTLAGRVSWSVSSVRRELGLMEQLGLVRATKPVRAAQWHLTVGGEILWLLVKGERRTPVLAKMLGQPRDYTHAEAVRLVHAGLIRGRPDGDTRAWRLAGKAAR